MQREQIDDVLLVVDDKNFRARHGAPCGTTSFAKRMAACQRASRQAIEIHRAEA
jgi:hypothetical protein